MRSYQRYFFCVAALSIAAWTASRAVALAADTPPLKLVKTIKLADIHSGECVSIGRAEFFGRQPPTELLRRTQVRADHVARIPLLVQYAGEIREIRLHRRFLETGAQMCPWK